MLIVINKLNVKEEKRLAFEDFINSRMGFIRDSDCLSYSFERPTDIEMGPSDFYVLRSVWNDMEHLRSWMKSDLFQKAHENFEGSQEFYFKENEMFFHEGIEVHNND